MKKAIITTVTIILISFMYACTKDSSTIARIPSPGHGSTSVGTYGIAGHHMSRLSSNYSRSITVDTANRMLESYLNGVGYPGVDTAIRSLSFDADTLRAYLQNSNIVTMKFMIAHPPAYMKNGNTNVNAGLNASGMTLIIVGLDNTDRYVMNSQNGVYDYMSPCPSQCPTNSGTYIQ